MLKSKCSIQIYLINNTMFKVNRCYQLLRISLYSWLELPVLSSGFVILLIPVRKSSSPLKTIASEYPLSALQTGHVFVRASVPLYQPFTQYSHTSRVLQHLVKIGGILIGACKQSLHLNASVIIFFMARGTVLVLSSSLMSRTTAAMPAISSISSRSL